MLCCLQAGLVEALRKLNEMKELTSDPSSVDAQQVSNFTNILEEVFEYSLDEPQVKCLLSRFGVPSVPLLSYCYF